MLKKSILFFLIITSQIHGMVYVGSHSIQNCDEGKAPKDKRIAPQNEDRVLLQIDPGYADIDLLFGIFDGHGGSQVSNFAATNLSEYVKDSFVTKPPCGFTEDQKLGKSLTCMDADILSRQEFNTCGSTALVGCIRNNQLHFANIGDSRALIVKRDGKYLLTKEHTPIPTSADANHIQKNGGSIVTTYTFLKDGNKYCLDEISTLNQGQLRTSWAEQDRILGGLKDANESTPYLNDLKSNTIPFLNSCQDFRVEYFVQTCKNVKHSIFIARIGMSRSLGDILFKIVGTTARPDLYSFDVADVNYVILASDGFWDSFNAITAQQQVYKLWKQYPCNPNAICGELVNKARLRGSKDDISVILLVFTSQNEA